MIYFSNSRRSTQAEIMDDFELQGNELHKLLTDLKNVNILLGGNNITLNGIQQLITKEEAHKTIKILDVGCGDGAMLRKIAKWGNIKGYRFELIGIDANPHILKEAKNRSKHYTNISFKQINVFDENKEFPEIDIALCTLFLHHFSDAAITQLVSKLTTHTKIGIVINDLQRSKLAFVLFKLFRIVFIKTKIAKFDGLVSIARSFKKNELLHMSKFIQGNHNIQWKWAFRYQWVIKNKRR